MVVRPLFSSPYFAMVLQAWTAKAAARGYEAGEVGEVVHDVPNRSEAPARPNQLPSYALTVILVFLDSRTCNLCAHIQSWILPIEHI